MMWSLLSLPFEADEVALILQMRPEKVRFLLATGGMPNSYVLRELLPTRTKLMTGWDLLEYLIWTKMRDLVPHTAAKLSNRLVDELARIFDDDSDAYRELGRTEIWLIVEEAWAELTPIDRTPTNDTFPFCAVLADILQQSWRYLQAGLTRLYTHVRTREAQSPWARRTGGSKSIFGLLRSPNFNIQFP
jgi:hypothetical protein